MLCREREVKLLTISFFSLSFISPNPSLNHALFITGEVGHRMAATALLQGAATFLSTHSGRDKLLRTIQFASTLCSGCAQRRWKPVAEKLDVLSSCISEARTMLRFLSDVPALSYVLSSPTSLEKEVNSALVPELRLISCFTIKNVHDFF